MSLARPSRLITMATLLVAGCFCLASFAQLPHPWRSPSAAALAGPHQNLLCHASEEVSPRAARLPVPFAVGLIPIVLASPHALIPRSMTRVTPGAIESWLILRRTSPAPPDHSEPA